MARLHSFSAPDRHMSNCNSCGAHNIPYYETRFRVKHPKPDWPIEFVILSAYATTGESWTTHQNEAADSKLKDTVLTRSSWSIRVIGYSPVSGHTEPSWATDIHLNEACDIGRQFHQDAIYHVKHDELSLAYCEEEPDLVHVGDFRARIDWIPG